MLRVHTGPLLTSLALTGVTAFLFYRSWIAMAALLPLCIPVMRKMEDRAEKKRKDRLSEEFGEALAGIITGLRAGYSPENAFRETASDMAFRFGKGAEMTRELAIITKGLDNRVPLSRLLEEFAARSGITEIRDFAQVFGIASRNGGNMVLVMEQTGTLLQERLEVEREIRLLISSRQLELRIMEAVPFAIIFYISLTNRGFFDPLYHNPAGAVFMTVCLALYLAACALGEKIADIRL
ncbi:MAG: type II secretion system F family protein [bacterium]